MDLQLILQLLLMVCYLAEGRPRRHHRSHGRTKHVNTILDDEEVDDERTYHKSNRVSSLRRQHHRRSEYNRPKPNHSTNQLYEEWQNVITEGSQPWHNAEIPYVIDTLPGLRPFDRRELGRIKEAMYLWARHSCIMFRPRRETDTQSLLILRTGPSGGCSSSLGVEPFNNVLTLGRTCLNHVRTVMHELGHAIGLSHEHSRPDRDNYVTLHWQNINPASLGNFPRYDDVITYGVPYDYASVMHYGKWDYSHNGEPTLVATDKKWRARIGHSNEPSFYDYKRVNLMYNCAARCGGKQCPGDSFVGRTCQCMCKDREWKYNMVRPCGPRDEENEISNDTDCWDRNPKCAAHAAIGKCETEPELMAYHCARTCDFC